MQFQKTLGALCFALALNMGINGESCAESAPPDQTDTDSGGGGNMDTGAGNGGSGDPGTKQAGKSPTPKSCYVATQPTWFPAGPPLGDNVVKVDLMRYMHFVYYNTNQTMSYTYLSSSPDSVIPIPGTFETWADTGGDPEKPQDYFECID
jgi:hypothetical protein